MKNVGWFVSRTKRYAPNCFIYTFCTKPVSYPTLEELNTKFTPCRAFYPLQPLLNVLNEEKWWRRLQYRRKGYNDFNFEPDMVW